MNYNGWQYFGDINLEHGGVFIKKSTFYFDIVEIIPDSNMDGADNIFHIISGSLDYETFDNNKNKIQKEECDSDIVSLAYRGLAYHGFDGDTTDTIRIGKEDPFTNHPSSFGKEIQVVRGNTKLYNYVKKNYLAG